MSRKTSGGLAYSYPRFSSPEQAKGDSLRRQIQLRDDWLQRTGVKLETSLSFRDEGVSGYTGEHRSNADRHALAAFLELVRAGRIPRGSYLIVESLDRLSREHIRPALTLLLNLIEAGIRVVQLLPIETIYDEQVEPMQLMMGIMELSRGHSESRFKSERVGRAWQEKKRRAAKDGEVLTRTVPGWIEVAGGKFRLIPERAEAVRAIYRLATEGHGIGVITQRLNRDGTPVIGGAAYWARSYVAKILASRSVFGECQPHKGRGGPSRKPDDPPIPGYFPAAIPEDRFHAARAALARRRNKAGRVGKRVNVFQGLLFDARDGGSLHQTQKSGGLLLVSYRATQGLAGSKYVSFPFPVFERAILERLREIDPKDILPRKDGVADRVQNLAGRIADVEACIAKIKSRLLIDEDIESLVDVLRTLEADKRALAGQLAAARQAAAAPVSEGWGEFRTLVDVLDEADDSGDMRVRLRGALRRIDFFCIDM